MLKLLALYASVCLFTQSKLGVYPPKCIVNFCFYYRWGWNKTKCRRHFVDSMQSIGYWNFLATILPRWVAHIPYLYIGCKFFQPNTGSDLIFFTETITSIIDILHPIWIWFLKFVNIFWCTSFSDLFVDISENVSAVFCQ